LRNARTELVKAREYWNDSKFPANIGEFIGPPFRVKESFLSYVQERRSRLEFRRHGCFQLEYNQTCTEEGESDVEEKGTPNRFEYSTKSVVAEMKGGERPKNVKVTVIGLS
jgi:hypothetical protein